MAYNPYINGLISLRKEFENRMPDDCERYIKYKERRKVSGKD